MNTVIGKCSICGGPVSVPEIWHGVVPPTPTCERCGATHEPQDSLPTLPMRRANYPNHPGYHGKNKIDVFFNKPHKIENTNNGF